MQSLAIDNRGFNRALWIAASLHVALFFALGVMKIKPKTDFPFQIVNIRLGDGGQRKPAQQPAMPPENNTNIAPAVVNSTVAKAAPIPKTKPTPKAEAKFYTWRRTRAKDENFRPVARTLEDYIKKGEKSGLAGLIPETDEEVTQRYTQVLSLWLYKYRDFPEIARRQGLTGKALIRLRIERTGRILFYQLDRSTGQPMLDTAIRDMVYRANPVPEAPGHFPGGSQLEFLIPIAFTLD
jgi:TonB family protein